MTIVSDTLDLSGKQFTHLFARITEEDDCYVVQVRLHNETTPPFEGELRGEEDVESIESATEMIAALAEEFSIPQERIKLELRMEDILENTRH